MAHFLIADPDEALRRRLRQALEPAGNVADETADAGEVAELVAHAAATHDPFDLLLMGAGTPAAGSHSLVQLGGAPGGLHGALGLIPADAGEDAIRAVFNAALASRERQLGRQEVWARALGFLDGLAATPAASTLKIAPQREAISQAQQRIPAAIAGQDEAAAASTLAALSADTTKTLQANGIPLPAFLDAMSAYQATPSFWIALREAYAKDRVRAFALLSELERLQRDKLAHGRANPAGHFVLPLFGTHRLFFRWSHGVRVLEDVAPAEREAAVLERLAHAPEAPVPLATGQLVL